MHEPTNAGAYECRSPLRYKGMDLLNCCLKPNEDFPDVGLSWPTWEVLTWT